MIEPRVLLVGLPGVGKTAVGRALAERIGWPWLDNSELLARVSDHSYDQEVADGGLAVQDRLDSAALNEALTEVDMSVAEVPPGVVESTYDRGRLAEGGFVVWVRAPARLAAAHLADGGDPPAWAGADARDTEATLQELGDERDDLYAEVAALTIDTSEVSPAQAAEQIEQALRGVGLLPDDGQPTQPGRA